MAYVDVAELPTDYPPFLALRERLGFVPALFSAQSLLPRAIEAQASIAGVFLLGPGALSSMRKEEILVAVAAGHRNSYCVAVHASLLEKSSCPAGEIVQIARGTFEGFAEPRAALLDFSVRLALVPTSIGPSDFERLRSLGFGDEEILESVQTAALGQFLCTLSTGLGVEADFELSPPIRQAMDANAGRAAASSASSHRGPGPYLRAVDLKPETFPPFAFLKASFGFVPRIFRAQTLKPESLVAEVQAIRDILLTEDVLTRAQKEYILLVISAANLNTYCVAVHCEMLRALGVPPDTSDQIAVDHRRSSLSDADKALLDAALKLAVRPREFGEADTGLLRAHGFSDRHILEAIIMASLTNFLNTLQMGLGTTPDFRPRRDFLAESASQAAAAQALANVESEDSDAPLAARARAGDAEAFEALVRRHQGLVYRTLLGLTGRAEDAEDGSQAAFVNAFRKIRDFAGTARFSTWLTRIAINEGLERLRRRHPTESLDAAADDDELFRPSLIAAWVDDPERVYAREEMRQIVRQELARLPLRYRAAVMLRDIEQLSTAEAAAALDLPVATLKTRLLRGRLMMREALAPYFAGGGPGARPA
jgi:RNA polymerase sigma-70 factor, ECF subfamily